MKIFVSWSGQAANTVALALKAWLPQLNPQFDVFVSTESIRPGKTWFDEVRDELKTADFGIGVFTPENISSTWMFFEHGAIAGQKEFAPLLCGCKASDLKGTPASLFQGKELQKQPFFELVLELNNKCGKPHNPDTLKKLFGRLWPDLNKKTAAAIGSFPSLTDLSSALHSTAPIDSSASIEVLPPYADLELQKIFRDAKERVECLVLSGRNLFSPAVFETLRERILSPEGGFKVRILAMDVYSDGHFLEHRKEMDVDTKKTDFEILSCLIAMCVKENKEKLTCEQFYKLTSNDYIPHIDQEAAVEFLAIERERRFWTDSNSFSSVQSRCIRSLLANWEGLRKKFPSDEAYWKSLRRISPSILGFLLMHASGTVQSEDDVSSVTDYAK